MLIAQVQFAPWDKAYDFLVGALSLTIGTAVIVKTELGTELGHVLALSEAKNNGNERELKPITRIANDKDCARLPSEARKQEVLTFCREMIAKHNLPMKLVDIHFSFDGGRFNFAFISGGRVDFRELVKDLITHFNVNIRLTQIGTRDEAKLSGDCGGCGRDLCCRGFIKDFSSITSEMAEAQQVVHRGSERISGMCGRLLCCLSYEYEGYKEMAGKLPPLGTKIKVNNGASGTVIGHHILKQSVDVRIKSDKPDERDLVIEVDLSRRQPKR